MTPPYQSPPDAGRPAGAEAFELVHTDLLRDFSALVAELGGDPDDYAGALAATLAPGGGSGPRLHYRSMIDLLERAAARLHRPDFGMRLAARQGPAGVFGPLGVVMRNTATLGDALAYVAGHIHAYSLAASLRIRFDGGGTGGTGRTDGGGDRVIVAFDVLIDNVVDRSQSLEQQLLLGRMNVGESTGGQARVREVWFRHRAVSAPRVYRERFGCDVRFEQAVDAMILTPADLAAPIVDPDPYYHDLATAFIDTNFPIAAAPLHARVRGLVRHHLGGPACSLERIAEQVGLHPRTLNRRLSDERRSFAAIKNEVQRDLALYYIRQTDLPFGLVSERLGYAEASVFSRACLRWFGASPRALRARAADG